MSEFKRLLVERELQDYCDDFYKELFPSVTALNEAILSRAEVLDVFDAAETNRSGGHSNIKKAKAFYDKTLEPKLKDLAQKAADSPFAKKVASGSQEAIAAVDSAVDSSIRDLKSKLQDTEQGSKIVDAASKIGQMAKDNPKTAAFAVGALTAAATMATSGVAGPTMGMMLKGALEMTKGSSFSTAVAKGAKTAAIAGGIGMGVDMGAEEIASALADGAVPQVEMEDPTSAGDGRHLRVKASIVMDNTVAAETNLLLASPEHIEEWEKISNMDDMGQKAIAIEEFEDKIEAETDQEALERDIDKASQRNSDVRNKADDYATNIRAGGAAAAGATTANAERKQTNDSINYDDVMNLHYKLNEGPLDGAKKLGKDIASAASGAAGSAAKSLGGKLKSKMLGSKEEITAKEIEDTWRADYGSSLDTNDIDKLLKSKGFTSLQIRKIYKKANIDKKVNSDEGGNVQELSNAIKDLGIEKEVASWIQRNQKKLFKQLPESIVLETKLSDKDVKDIFTAISKVPIEPKQEEPEQQEPEQEDNNVSPNESVNVWASMINEMPSKADKLLATNKLFNYLTNETRDISTTRGISSIENHTPIVETLNDGRVVTTEVYRTFKRILEMCELSWNDFLTRPVKISEYIKFKAITYQKQVLSEATLGRKRK